VREPKILIIDDDTSIVEKTSVLLAERGYATISAGSGQEGLVKAKDEGADLVLLDLYLPEKEGEAPRMLGLDILASLNHIVPETGIIMISGQADINTAVKATKAGAMDFVEKGNNFPHRLLVSVKNALEMMDLKTENVKLSRELKKKQVMIGESEAMKELWGVIERAAPSKGRVLICGENGTGKELVAAAIHQKSPRRKRPFVKLNCAAIPRDLIESELFGHEKGAFTGATTRKEGKFELADTGTLLLDEIGDMSLDTQAKLLRVLEENEFEHLGGKTSIKVDVRVISSTNKDLPKEISEGNFREDLFFRVSVIPIVVPPLRARKDDIPPIAQHYLELFCVENNKPPKEMSDGAVKVMMSYHWPGNVRELKNLVERLVIMTDEKTIKETHVTPLLSDAKVVSTGRSMSDLVENFEKSLIVSELKRTGWNVSQAAARLRIDRANLHRKMRRYGIQRETKDTDVT
jgi:two-component system nitrogen regulation response regulator NtrX